MENAFNNWVSTIGSDYIYIVFGFLFMWCIIEIIRDQFD